MKRFALGLMFVCTAGHAQWNYDNRASREFDISQNAAESMTVTWTFVEENKIAEACQKASIKYGNNGFAVPSMACTFTWTKERRCHIITPRRASMQLIGHEVMHCFQGNWHP